MQGDGKDYQRVVKPFCASLELTLGLAILASLGARPQG